jgi:GNAT superfamily N-acetyltransferase
MQIRIATPADAVTLAELLGHLGYPADAAEIPARLGAIVAAGGTVLMGWDGSGAAAGLVGLQALPVLHASRPVAYITALAVAPSAQGQGVGRALVAAAEAWARAAGCSRLTVTSAEHRDGAHAFYPRVGLPYTGRRYSRLLDEPASRPAT